MGTGGENLDIAAAATEVADEILAKLMAEVNAASAQPAEIVKVARGGVGRALRADRGQDSTKKTALQAADKSNRGMPTADFIRLMEELGYDLSQLPEGAALPPRISPIARQLIHLTWQTLASVPGETWGMIIENDAMAINKKLDGLKNLQQTVAKAEAKKAGRVGVSDSAAEDGAADEVEAYKIGLNSQPWISKRVKLSMTAVATAAALALVFMPGSGSTKPVEQAKAQTRIGAPATPDPLANVSPAQIDQNHAKAMTGLPGAGVAEEARKEFAAQKAKIQANTAVWRRGV